MNLLVRLNLLLGVALGLVCLLGAYGCWVAMQNSAQYEMEREAGLIVDSALATHSYTAAEVSPLLSEQMRTQFLPQSIPFYAATQNFLKLREQHPEYSYKEAALNPTNPRDRATDWEADLIQKFRNDPDTREIVGERDTPVGRSLYLARPVRTEDECLACHSSPSSAPASLVARYGRDNGFGWQSKEIVGAHIVSVPLSGAIARARSDFRLSLIAILGAAAIVLLMVNTIVYFLVVRPVRRIAQIAERVSVGDESSGEFPQVGTAEISGLALSFGRMRVSLEKAMLLLEK
ncbi:MAG TPA: DUF3365 domain-containing protein [Steroidobacteraceae bacterium]|jgi:protein-histidine pros-kinase